MIPQRQVYNDHRLQEMPDFLDPRKRFRVALEGQSQSNPAFSRTNPSMYYTTSSSGLGAIPPTYRNVFEQPQDPIAHGCVGSHTYQGPAQNAQTNELLHHPYALKKPNELAIKSPRTPPNQYSFQQGATPNPSERLRDDYAHQYMPQSLVAYPSAHEWCAPAASMTAMPIHHQPQPLARNYGELVVANSGPHLSDPRLGVRAPFSYAANPYGYSTLSRVLAPRGRCTVTKMVPQPNGKATNEVVPPTSVVTMRCKKASNSWKKRKRVEDVVEMEIKELDEFYVDSSCIVSDNEMHGRHIAVGTVPFGYTAEIRFRQSGAGSGRHFIVYHTPEDKVLRSGVQLRKNFEQRYIMRAF